MQCLFVGDSFIPNGKETVQDLHQKYKNSEGVLMIRFAKQELYG